LDKAEDIGIELQPYWGQRPCPSCPRKFKVLKAIKIREKRSITSREIGNLNKDDVVYIDKIKKLGARLKRTGWVSLSSDRGVPLLEQID